MNLESEVVSLPYAQLFKELNLFQDAGCVFNWIEAAWTYEINSHLEKRVTESKTKLVFGDPRMITDRFNEWPAPTIGMLMAWMPQYVTLKDNEPFNNFRFRIEKCHLAKENEILPHYIANFRCDSTEVHGERAWMERLLFQHNKYDTSLADCLAKVIVELYKLEYVK